MRRSAKKKGGGARGGGGMSNVQIQERHVVGVEDMVLLNRVENEEIVKNLAARFQANQIYTNIGPVLIAANPFQWLKLYEPHHIKMYTNAHLADLPPHIFAVAESAFRTMLSEEEKQTVIISGESGAGKTEAAKQIMNYIAAISGSGGNDRAVQEVKNIVLDSNPALEAFGNAMTLRNNNSSRFGKYFELRFDLAGGGTPRGGYVTNYLLEKSRVVKPGPGERSFHIFYQLLRGAPRETKESLGLTSVHDYNMLRMSGVDEVNNEGGRTDDAKEFKETIHSLQTLGLFPEDQHDFFLVIAIVLHLSNIDFYDVQVDGADGSQVQNEGAVENAAALLEVDAGSLAYVLTYRTLTTMAPGGKVEQYQVPMNASQARSARDALAKDLYSRVFDLLVKNVNKALESCGNNTRVSMRRELRHIGDDDGLSIGVLDIYGFEIFEENHFEQFCINYVNEKLQQIFIELTLRSEQEIYSNEGIQWQPVPFFDNKIVCDLIEGKKPPGVFAILDDTCKTAHSLGSADDKFLDKLISFQRQHQHLDKFRGGFTILHYAGKVDYSVNGFIEANKDVLGQDLQLMVQSSSNEFLLGLYPEKVDLDQRRQPTTAGYKIKQQCGDLVYALLDCNPHYVRCIKSNDQKSAGVFDQQRVTHQVRYLGLLENVKVRRAGFALRMEFFRFIYRFKVLATGYLDPKVLATGSDYEIAYAILDGAAYTVTALQQPGEAQLGRTMVFIKTPETYQALQNMRKKLVSEQAIKIQNVWRRFANRRDLVDLRVEMSDLWEQNRKESTPSDLLRNYHAFYIKDREMADAISNMLEVYQLSEIKKEKLEYTEVLDKINSKGQWQKVVFFLTDQAMYVADWVGKPIAPQPGSDPRKMQGQQQFQYSLELRRRTELRNVEGVLLSHEADDLLGILMTPQPKTKPDKSQWMDKSKVKRCMDTQQPFSFFGKSKHQCAYTGGVYVKESMVKVPGLPDRGFFSAVEVHRSVPGTVSVEMREDIVLQTEKKAELVAVLRNVVTRAKGGGHQLNKFDKQALRQEAARQQNAKPMCRALYDYQGAQDDELTIREGETIELLDSSHPDWWMGKLGAKVGVFPASYVEKISSQVAQKPKRANPNKYRLNVHFADQWSIRPAAVGSLSNTWKGNVFFQRNEQVRTVGLQKSGSKLVVHVPPGVAGRKLKQIQANQARRRERKEAERQALMEQRKQNAAAREAQRRADREKRLAAKKDKRRAEKAKRDKEQAGMNFAAKNAAKGGASFADRLARQNGSQASTGGRSGGGSGIAVTPPWAKAAAAANPKINRMSFNRAAIKPSAPRRQTAVIWEKYRDDDSGDIYYVGPDGRSQWEAPSGNVDIRDKTHL